jgi:DNA-binding transcriptional MerR regulator
MAQLKIPGQEVKFLSPSFPEIVHGVKSPVLSLKDTNASSRMMNYYSTNGLLLADAETKGKRRLSGTQVLWISILKELLSSNISKDIIFSLKEYCEKFEIYDYSNVRKYVYLEFIAALIIEHKSDIRLIVLPEGSYAFINFSNASNLLSESYYLSNTFISIPLFQKVQTIWRRLSEQEIEKKKVVLEEVKPNEQTVLNALRAAKGEVDEVVIMLRNNTPQKIMINQTIDPKAIGSVVKFLRGLKNCKIELSYGSVSGTPTYIRKKETIKPPRDR